MTYLLVKTVTSQKSSYRSGQQGTEMTPCDQFESKVSRFLIPSIVNVVGTRSNEGEPVALRSPDIVD